MEFICRKSRSQHSLSWLFPTQYRYFPIFQSADPIINKKHALRRPNRKISSQPLPVPLSVLITYPWIFPILTVEFHHQQHEQPSQISVNLFTQLHILTSHSVLCTINIQFRIENYIHYIWVSFYSQNYYHCLSAYCCAGVTVSVSHSDHFASFLRYYDYQWYAVMGICDILCDEIGNWECVMHCCWNWQLMGCNQNSQLHCIRLAIEIRTHKITIHSPNNQTTSLINHFRVPLLKDFLLHKLTFHPFRCNPNPALPDNVNLNDSKIQLHLPGSTLKLKWFDKKFHNLDMLGSYRCPRDDCWGQCIRELFRTLDIQMFVI